MIRVGFIGAGKVATAFGRYLHGRGVTISGYCDRHVEKTSHACNATRSQAFATAAEAAGLSDMLLITTRDDQIAGVCAALCSQNALAQRHLVGHMSGAHASSILAAAAKLGAAIFSLHPLQAFADEEQALADLPATYFSLEGSDPRLAAVEQILKRIGNPLLRLAPEHKSLYHLAACVFSNYLVTLIDDGLQALAKSGIAPQQGFKAMQPLIQSTIANIERMGTERALTGPIARGDAGTVRQHLAALEAHGLMELKHTYLLLGRQTLDLATRTVLKEPARAAALRRLLAEEPEE